MQWIWQSSAWPEFGWPKFSWKDEPLQPLLRAVQQKSGVLQGKASLSSPAEQSLQALLANIVASSAIEDEKLNAQSVRSSLARHLGISEEQPYPVSERSEGLAEMMMDALQNHQQVLTVERLYQWHRWLFPQSETGFLNKIRVGQLRGPEPMQVVSGRLDRPTVHYEAPPRAGLEQAVQQFIDWFNLTAANPASDPLLRAAVTHLWFVTLHPFDDGNGRLTRALTDMALAQADSQSVRLYAMSVAILADRKGYYAALNQTQQLASSENAKNNGEEGNDTVQTLDITPWLRWFLQTLEAAIDSATRTIDRTIEKTRFWQQHRDTPLSKEQIRVLNLLLDGGEKGFEDGISASQYQKVAKVSKATATRHLADLLEKGCIEKLPGGGRSTRYRIAG